LRRSASLRSRYCLLSRLTTGIPSPPLARACARVYHSWYDEEYATDVRFRCCPVRACPCRLWRGWRPYPCRSHAPAYRVGGGCGERPRGGGGGGDGECPRGH